MGNTHAGHRRDGGEVAAAENALVWLGLTPEAADRFRVAITLPLPEEPRKLPVAVSTDRGRPTELGDVLDDEAFDRIDERLAQGMVKFVPDDFSARLFPARVYANWLQALGLPDFAEQVRKCMADITPEGVRFFIANATTPIPRGGTRAIKQTQALADETHCADDPGMLQTRVETTYDERTDEDVTYTVQSHRSFLADIALINGRELLIHPRIRDREPTPDEIRELATGLNALAGAAEEALKDVREAQG